MQLTKRSVWIATALLAGLFLWHTMAVPDQSTTAARSVRGNVAGFALALNIYAPVVFGCLLADRLIRDRRLGVAEVLDAAPASFPARLAGKYLGVVGGCLLPMLVVWTAGLARIGSQQPAWPTVGYGLAAFATISVPALLFVGAFALAGPTVLGAPLFRVLLVGYWFWSLVPSSVMPSLSGTLLTPVGDVARTGLFGISGTFTSLNRETASVLDAVASIGLLLGLGLLALVALAAGRSRLRNTR